MMHFRFVSSIFLFLSVFQNIGCNIIDAPAGKLFRYGRIILATTTYNAEIFPFMREFIEHLTERNYKGRKVGFVENGSWAPMAAKVMKTMLEPCKDMTYMDTTVKILSAVTSENEEQINQLATEILA